MKIYRQMYGIKNIKLPSNNAPIYHIGLENLFNSMFKNSLSYANNGYYYMYLTGKYDNDSCTMLIHKKSYSIVRGYYYKECYKSGDIHEYHFYNTDFKLFIPNQFNVKINKFDKINQHLFITSIYLL